MGHNVFGKITIDINVDVENAETEEEAIEIIEKELKQYYERN